MNKKVIYIDIKKLSPIEGHGPKRVDWLKKKIIKEGFWTQPLKIEKTKNLVMDGHHRFEVAKKLDLARVPVYTFHYSEVELYSLRKNIEVSADIIFENYRKNLIYPYKTAKHIFPDIFPDFEGVSLNELK